MFTYIDAALLLNLSKHLLRSGQPGLKGFLPENTCSQVIFSNHYGIQEILPF